MNGAFVRAAWFLWGFLCALSIVLVLVVAPRAAQAGIVAIGEAKGDRITLTDEACTSPVLEKIKPQYRAHFLAATYYVGQTRQTVPGCYWRYQQNYLLIWEDGDVFELPLRFFRQHNARGALTVVMGIRG